MEEMIRRFVKKYVQAYSRREGTRTRYRTPVVAYAAAADPLFMKLKDHRKPEDLLPDAKTVITYFIPFDERIAVSNRGEGESSLEWAHAYIETNTLIESLGNALGDELRKDMVRSFAPPPTHNYDPKTLTSEWSHKHVAFIAGLGTFGQHQMLITDMGACGRLGSTVIDRELVPTPRPTYEFCLYKRDGSCLECVARCTFGALKESFFDRNCCCEICMQNAVRFKDQGPASVCGKCVSVVRCSFQVP
jgi:epoxyqueuosine reductase QueG